MAIIGDKFYCRWENTGKLHHISTVQSGFGIPKHRCRTFDAKMILFSSIKDLWELVLCCLDFSSQELIFWTTSCWPYKWIYGKHIVIWHDPMPSVLVFSDTWHYTWHHWGSSPNLFGHSRHPWCPAFQRRNQSTAGDGWKKTKKKKQCTLPETNSSHLKIDTWKRRFLFKTIIFRCYVSFSGATSLWTLTREKKSILWRGHKTSSAVVSISNKASGSGTNFKVTSITCLVDFSRGSLPTFMLSVG